MPDTPLWRKCVERAPLIGRTTKYSLALRHQVFIRGDPIDPYHTWERNAFQAPQHLPATDTSPAVQYDPRPTDNTETVAKDGKFPHARRPPYWSGHRYLYDEQELPCLALADSVKQKFRCPHRRPFRLCKCLGRRFSGCWVALFGDSPHQIGC